jgi:hypothetical protein
MKEMITIEQLKEFRDIDTAIECCAATDAIRLLCDEVENHYKIMAMQIHTILDAIQAPIDECRDELDGAGYTK